MRSKVVKRMEKEIPQTVHAKVLRVTSEYLQGFCTCGNPSKKGFVDMEEDGETLSYYCCDCGKKRKTK